MIASQHDPAPRFVIEAHPYAATLYVQRGISVAGLLEAVRKCDALPESVWFLRVELSAAHLLDDGALTVLSYALRCWREGRSGVTYAPAELRSASRITRLGARWRLTRSVAHRDRFAVKS
jgi:hypothetical protein